MPSRTGEPLNYLFIQGRSSLFLPNCTTFTSAASLRALFGAMILFFPFHGGKTMYWCHLASGEKTHTHMHTQTCVTKRVLVKDESQTSRRRGNTSLMNGNCI
ncbi:hypothetical protein CHARACLAT_018662 [Characodon lateralis]|uniref:Uncharacterized protein n=1 Tax=Characodon lateralis TaxID=208331 RepID=A0ABU7EC55_9TELE|nr:hypothetical protein [Characodon lateralis]